MHPYGGAVVFTPSIWYRFDVSYSIHKTFYVCVLVYPEASVSKKKRVCVHVVPVGSVETAVLNIKLTAKSKMMLQHYTYVGLVPLTYTNLQVK